LNRLAYPEEMQEDLVSRINLHARSQHFPEGSYVLKKGQVCNKAFFLAKGLARSYYMNQGKEVTSRLMEEGFIITSWLSFYSQQPSNEYIIAMEPCETLYLDFTDINKLYKEFSLFNIIGRKQVEHSFCQAELRTQMLRGLSAVQRYEYFCEKHDSLLQRVPLKYIASYLGMSDETISRIRSSYKKKKNLDKCQDG
jgi:CRP/FNR family transcriptional regulator, anaerobic regulatory protein